MRPICMWLFIFTTLGYTQAPLPAEEILRKIDANLSSQNRILVSKMIIHGRRESRTVEAKSWVQGMEKAFTEYLAPAREKGTKMLKLGDQLWMYSPYTDRTIQISGHLLRQSVMGSDLSYEDMMQDPRLVEHYHAKMDGSEQIGDRACWVLSLQAKTTQMAYEKRKIWVDQERLIPLKQELYARSGKLLKKLELFDVRKIDNRWFPMRMVFKDMLKTGQGTEFIIESIAFDQPIPDHILTKAALKK